MPYKPTGQRRSRAICTAMPDHLDLQHVVSVTVWPLGRVMTGKAAGTGWTDIVLHMVDSVRLGGKHNSRRVRYDGRFYVTYNSRNVYLVGALAWQVWEAVSHVYGIDADSDAQHNAALKGY